MSAQPPADAPSPRLEVVRSGLVSFLLRPLTNGIAVACVAAMLTPLLVAFAVGRGVESQMEAAAAASADVVVLVSRLGRSVPVPISAIELVRAVPGVTAVEPVVIGGTTLGIDRVPVVVVGRTFESIAGAGLGALVEGRLPAPGSSHEVVVGSTIASRLSLRPGSVIPPFYRNDAGERIVLVVGVFRGGPMWQSHALLTDVATAGAFFEDATSASALLVSCAPEYREAVRLAISRIPDLRAESSSPPLRPRVATKDDLAIQRRQFAAMRSNVLLALGAAACAFGVPLLLATTGLGLVARRREVGLLKALGWGTDDVVLRSLVESAVVAVLGAASALLAAWCWIRLFGAAGVVGILVPDAGVVPAFDVPAELAPGAVLLALALAFVVVSAGTLLAAWRSSSAPAAEAMR